MSKTTTTTETYCIISDVTIDTHDAQVRLYWDGDCWGDDVEASLDYPNMEAANKQVRKVRSAHPAASIQMLAIRSETKCELIDIH